MRSSAWSSDWSVSPTDWSSGLEFWAKPPSVSGALTPCVPEPSPEFEPGHRVMAAPAATAMMRARARKAPSPVRDRRAGSGPDPAAGLEACPESRARRCRRDAAGGPSPDRGPASGRGRPNRVRRRAGRERAGRVPGRCPGLRRDAGAPQEAAAARAGSDWQSGHRRCGRRRPQRGHRAWAAPGVGSSRPDRRARAWSWRFHTPDRSAGPPRSGLLPRALGLTCQARVTARRKPVPMEHWVHRVTRWATPRGASLMAVAPGGLGRFLAHRPLPSPGRTQRSRPPGHGYPTRVERIPPPASSSTTGRRPPVPRRVTARPRRPACSRRGRGRLHRRSPGTSPPAPC